MIKFYRKYLSPLKSTKCPYIPTCSEYGLEAVDRFLMEDMIRYPEAAFIRQYFD